jgi:hypothetical protein
MTREEFIGFADEVLAKKAEKSELTAEIKEAKETFAETHNMDKASVNAALKAYEEYLKDQTKFAIVDRECEEIINIVCYQTEDEEEATEE